MDIKGGMLWDDDDDDADWGEGWNILTIKFIL